MHHHILSKGVVTAMLFIGILTFFGGAMQKLQLYTSDSLAAVYARTLVALANENRTEESLDELVVNPKLEEAARLKAEDMAANGYFAHFGPDGTAPWDWIDEAGYAYVYAGENLAIDFNDSDEVDRAWMKSPLHRANILNSNFTEIGIATAAGTYKGKETIFVVQMFGTPKAALAQPVTITPQTASVIAPVPTVIATSSVVATNTEESFVAVKGAYDVQVAAAETADRIVTNPTRIAYTIYILLFALVSVGLLSMIFSEFHKHHVRHAIIGIISLAVIVILALAYKAAIVSHIIIG